MTSNSQIAAQLDDMINVTTFNMRKALYFLFTVGCAQVGSGYYGNAVKKILLRFWIYCNA
jgi:hypothetical protein